MNARRLLVFAHDLRVGGDPRALWLGGGLVFGSARSRWPVVPAAILAEPAGVSASDAVIEE